MIRCVFGLSLAAAVGLLSVENAYAFEFDVATPIKVHPDIKADLGAVNGQKLRALDLGDLSKVVPVLMKSEGTARHGDIKSFWPKYLRRDEMLASVVAEALDGLSLQTQLSEPRAEGGGSNVEHTRLAALFPVVFVEGATRMWHAMARRQRRTHELRWITNELSATTDIFAAAKASLRAGMGKIRNAGLYKGPAGIAIVQKRKSVTFTHYVAIKTATILNGVVTETVPKQTTDAPSEVVIKAGILYAPFAHRDHDGASRAPDAPRSGSRLNCVAYCRATDARGRGPKKRTRPLPVF